MSLYLHCDGEGCDSHISVIFFQEIKGTSGWTVTDDGAAYMNHFCSPECLLKAYARKPVTESKEV